MRWGTWLLIGFIFLIDVSIFTNSFLSQYLKRKKNEKVKYSIGGIILTIIITAYLLVPTFNDEVRQKPLQVF